MLVLEDLVGLHRTIQIQLLQHYWLGHRLRLLDIEWFALETNRDHSVVFQIASKDCILDSFVDCDGYSISSKVFLHSPILVHFSLPIPKMLTFTLAICLTTSNLP